MTAPDADPVAAKLDFAKKIARQAGALIKDRFGRAVAEFKEDRSLVTDADHAAQALILDRLADAFPADAVLAEETIFAPDRHASLGSAENTWVVDPIDGTRNYARGFPIFSVSIAMLVGSRPTIGVIYDPMTDFLYSAARGRGAFLNDRPVSVSSQPRPGGELVAVHSSRSHPLDTAARNWLDWVVLRNVGSTALHIALIAAGCIDGAYSPDPKLWDIAAGTVLIEEAGGVITRPDGSPMPDLPLTAYANSRLPFIAGTPDIHDRLIAAFKASANT